MRILIDATAAMSGGKVYLEHLLPPLLRMAQGHEFIILHNGELEAETMVPGGTRVHWQLVAGLAASNRVWIGKAIVKLFWRLLILPYQIWLWQPDVVFSNAGFAPAWMPRHTRLVLALHNSMPLRAELIAAEHSPLHRWRLQLLRRLIARSVRRADAAIVFSQDTRERLKQCFGPLAYEPSVIYHGIDGQMRNGESERPALTNASSPGSAGRSRSPFRTPYLLYVSQFHRYKNLGVLLEAFARIQKQHPQLTLVLIGEAADAQYWQEVEAQVDRLNLHDSVHHLPELSRVELPAIYRDALAFVHPSLAETCSFPLLEALAAGTPVAAARMSALPEIAAEAAVYFDPYSAEDLAHVLERLLADSELRTGLRDKAKQRAAAFNWQEAAIKTLRLLLEVSNKHE
jgi:glycosyltransferase involved in cell wall biosynthesis